MKQLIRLGWVALMCVSAVAAAGPIPYAPTSPDQVPQAILGKGGKPQGASVAYFAADPKAQGYLAVPAGNGKHGAVILIHEWDGLGERVKQVADAFAAEGYVALAADLYSGRTGANPQENMALVKETLANPQRIIENLDAAVKFLKARKDVNGKVAAIGWCYGGGVALSFGLDGANHEGTAMFYGRLVDDPEKLKHLHHELYGTFAGHDENIKRDDVDHFVAALRGAGITNDVHIYDDVKHGFWLYVDRDPDANAAPALDAWQRLKAYLSRVLKSQ
jgi:carboxymethylenebutenolidase